MFERFTDDARRAVVLAQEEARSLGHTYIGTEHVLLGLLHEGMGVAAEALRSAGVSPEAVRTRVVEIVGRGDEAPSGHIPFTPRAKKVLELSLRESLQLGDDHIGTEHILLGLLREGEGVAALALHQEGVDLDQLRATVAAHLPAPGTRSRGRRWLRREREPEAQAHPHAPAETEPSPLERLDDGAWAALLAARGAARARSVGVVGMRDVLVGIASVPGPAAGALAAAGVDITVLADGGGVAAGDGSAVPAPAFSAAVRESLHWAVDDATRRGHPAAGTGHLLLALLTAPDADLDVLLEASGARRGDLHAEAARVLADDPGRAGAA